MNRTLSRASWLFLLFLAFSFPTRPTPAQDFVVWQAYNVQFEDDGIILLASTYVLNPNDRDYRQLVFTAAPPEAFTVELPPKEIQEASRRPEGFGEAIVDNAYRMTQQFLGAQQATTIFYRLRFDDTPPLDVSFPGIHVEFEYQGETKTFTVAPEVHNLSRIRRFSGDIGDFVKRNGKFVFDMQGDDDWTFTALDYRAFGQNPIGIIDIDGSPEGSGRFRAQAGYPGSFREVLVRWEPRTRGKKDPLTHEFARQAIEQMISWVGDFSLDEGSLQVSDTKVARYPAVQIQGRWNDNRPIRLGSGLFRFYVVNDPQDDRDFFLYLGVQGRGIGPDNVDKPAPDVEARLMEELVGYVEKFRP